MTLATSTRAPRAVAAYAASLLPPHAGPLGTDSQAWREVKGQRLVGAGGRSVHVECRKRDLTQRGHVAVVAGVGFDGAAGDVGLVVGELLAGGRC